MNKHTMYGRDSEGEMLVIGVLEHPGSYRFPLLEECVPQFDEDNEPCTQEGDTFRMGHDKYTGQFYVVVNHANGDSASFTSTRHMMYYQAERCYPAAAGELPLDLG